uniref:CSP13 n=1 Tax=Holotrichia parallela TaxID=93412 RepID=A0A0G2YGX8_HOLPA|nr:CSP13 [Holotrichia parallela]
MFKVLAVLCIFVVVTLAKPADEYTDKYDGVNIDEILNNKRLLQGYCNCLLDKGPCSPDGAELKRVLPEAIENNCEKCSEKHKNAARKVLKHVYEKEKDCWDPLEKKYDPKGDYKKRYKDSEFAEGINL